MSKTKILTIIILLLITKISAQSALDQWSFYKDLNDSELRYTEYKDSDEILRLKLEQLDYINSGRAKYNAPPVKLDILASRVANRMCRDAVEGNFTGHWNMRGEKPYHRYAFAGGTDHIMENASGEWRSSNFDISSETISTLMRNANDRFMGERAPNDGHKQNCIDPLHNYVGLGIALEGGQFRYYEEFIDRYLEFRNFEDTVEVNEPYTLTTKPISEDHLVYFALVYYEDFPSPMTRAQIQSKRSYSDYTSNTVIQLPPWDIPEPDRDRWTEIPLNFSKSGLYYVHIYLSETPWKSGQASTNGKIQGSGIVIRVE